MYLPISRLFWVSSLVYPNLLGTNAMLLLVVVKLIEKHINFYNI
jgi:hypothetical protein